MAIYSIDDTTGKVLDDCMPVFGAQSRAEMIKKALAFANICVRFTDQDGFLQMRDSNGRIVTIDMIF